MGWKGTLRTINAEANRQAKDNAKMRRCQQKQQELESDSVTVTQQEHMLKMIVSVHHVCNANLNWDDIRMKPSPIEPQIIISRTDAIQKNIKQYKPNFLDKTFMLSNWKRKQLGKKLDIAKEEDKKEYEKLLNDYQNNKNIWNKEQILADRLQNEDGKTYIDVIREYGQLSELPFGKDLKFIVSDKNEFSFDFKVSPQEEVIPDEEYSLRQSGTLSTKKMAKTKSIDIYQDHVCSCLLRVSREIFGLLPISSIQANILMKTLNTQTGYMEDQIIISALIKKETLHQLNLNNVDPSDSIKNFVHNMKFTKSKGFKEVQRISPL